MSRVSNGRKSWKVFLEQVLEVVNYIEEVIFQLDPTHAARGVSFCKKGAGKEGEGGEKRVQSDRFAPYVPPGSVSSNVTPS